MKAPIPFKACVVPLVSEGGYGIFIISATTPREEAKELPQVIVSITNPRAPRKMEHTAQGSKTVMNYQDMDHEFVMDWLR